MADNRRTTTRHAVSIPATVVVGDRSIDCTIQNLSLGGALIAATKRHSMGERCNLRFTVPTSDHEIDVGAVVRWSEASCVGIQFDGLRARDVWALNEYFKQLAG